MCPESRPSIHLVCSPSFSPYITLSLSYHLIPTSMVFPLLYLIVYLSVSFSDSLLSSLLLCHSLTLSLTLSLSFSICSLFSAPFLPSPSPPIFLSTLICKGDHSKGGDKRDRGPIFQGKEKEGHGVVEGESAIAYPFNHKPIHS